MKAPTPIQLLVGLGNPGKKYARTRHNVGAWWITQLATYNNTVLNFNNKYEANIALIQLAGHRVWLMQPTTFMNHSGQSVRLFSQFHGLSSESILVIHDDLDFPAGILRLKAGGGHGGHNGIRDIIQQLQTNQFYRLRIGIGHPGDRHIVHDYVLSNPSIQDQSLIQTTLEQSIPLLPELLSGNMEIVMGKLHTAFN